MCHQLIAQQEIVKVSKVKLLDFEEGIQEVIIQGEKASINVEAWGENYVSIRVKSIARNVHKKEAIADLAYIKYEKQIQDDRLALSNSFKGISKKITSNLSIEYLIKMPKDIILNIKNLYGPVSVNGINNISINVSFGKAEISNVSTKALVVNRYSDLEAIHMKGSLTIDSDKSNLHLKDVNASTKIMSKYGRIDCENFNTSSELQINALKSEIEIEILNPLEYNYNLKAAQGKVIFPNLQNMESGILYKENDASNPWININTTYNTIKIQTK